MPVQPPLTPLGASAVEQATINTLQRIADAIGGSGTVTTGDTLTGDGSPEDPLNVSFDAVMGMGVFELSVGVNGTYADLDAALNAAILAPHSAVMITLLDAQTTEPAAVDLSTAPTLARLSIRGAGRAFSQLEGLVATLGAYQWLEISDLTISSTSLSVTGGSGSSLRCFGVRFNAHPGPGLDVSGTGGAVLEGCESRDGISFTSSGSLTISDSDIGTTTLVGGVYGTSITASAGYVTVIGGTLHGQVAVSGTCVFSSAATLWEVGAETPISASGGACSVLMGCQALVIRHSAPVALSSGTGGVFSAGIIGGCVYGLPLPGTPTIPVVGGTWGSSASIPASVGGSSLLSSALLGASSGIATLTASGLVPQSQMATGSALVGRYAASDGAGGMVWTAPSGGGGITDYARVAGFSARATDPGSTNRAYFPTTSTAAGGVTVTSASTTGTYFQVAAAGWYSVTANAGLTAAGSMAIKGASALNNSLDPAADTDVIAWAAQPAALYPMSCVGQVELAAGDYVWLAASSGSGYPLIASLSLTRLA